METLYPQVKGPGISFKRLLKVISLNDESICQLFCSRPFPEDDEELRERMKQKRARSAFVLGIALIGVLTFFVKIFAEDMFPMLVNASACEDGTLTHSCFQLAMVGRFAATLFAYHFLLAILNAFSTPETDFANNFCWLLKVVVFSEIFFVCCLIPSSAFTLFLTIAKYFSLLFVVLLTILANDSFFFFFSRRRRERQGKEVSKRWITLCFVAGLSSFALGLALFAFNYAWFRGTCVPYIAINTVLLILGLVTVILAAVKFRRGPELNHAFVFFFMIATVSFGILGGTPYRKCEPLSEHGAIYVKIVSKLDSVIGLVWAMVILAFLANVELNHLIMAMPQKGRKFYSYLLINTLSNLRRGMKRAVEGSNEERQKGTGSAPERILQAKSFKKRVWQKTEVFFHLICAAFGIYFAALFSNWTSLWDSGSFNGKAMDYGSIWVRFAGHLCGLVYVLIISLRNIYH